MIYLNMLLLWRNLKKEMNNIFVVKLLVWVWVLVDGLFCSYFKLGDCVVCGELFGIIDGFLGGSEMSVKVLFGGIVIGVINLFLVNLGEVLLYVG